jgi:hypothetical protein
MVKCIIGTYGLGLSKRYFRYLSKKKKDQGYKSDKIDTYTLQVYQFDTSIHLLAENLTEILSSV